MDTLTMTQEIKKACTIEQIRRCYKVMRQLQPDIPQEEAFIEQALRQMEAGYFMVYIEEEGEIASVAGFRFLEFFAWGKVLYVDDLITDSSCRKKGYGSQLLNWLIEQAKLSQCDQLHLDSGPQRYDAHRLYLNHDLKIIGHHLALELFPNHM